MKKKEEQKKKKRSQCVFMNLWTNDSRMHVKTKIAPIYIFRTYLLVCVLSIGSCQSNMVGCYHCQVPPACSLQNEGIVIHQRDCYEKCTQVGTCHGVKFDKSTGECDSFQAESACFSLEYTEDDIFVYLKLSRTDCSLFTLILSSGWRYASSFKIDEIDPSTRGNCIHEGLERSGTYHVVYKPSWSDCYIFDACSICTPYTEAGMEKYDYICTADCGQLSNPSNGMVNITGGTLQENVATYSCDAGYSLTGTTTRTCDATGFWTDAEPTCDTTDCGPLAAPAAGTVYFLDTTYLNPAYYSCDPGFNLTGLEIRICLDSGSWSGDEPTCAAVDCGTPEIPSSGTVNYGSTTYMSSAHYSCNTGFTLSGMSVRNCSYDGNWEGEVPACEPVNCGTLDHPSSGKVNYSSTTYMSLANYSCEPGYNLTGAAVRHCTSDGNWDGDEPTCEPMKCPQLSGIQFGSVSITGGGYTGSVATYSCSEGYTSSHTESRVCFWDSTSGANSWNGTEPTCDPNECPQLSGIQFGSVSITGGGYTGSVATYSCSEGYTSSHTESRVCFWGSTSGANFWNGTEPTCIQNAIATTVPSGTTVQPVTPVPTAPVTTTTVTVKPQAIYLWPCLCSNHTFDGLSHEEIIQQLVNDVKIDEEKTTLSRSKKECMTDTRTSAKGAGIVAISLLGAGGGLILLLDLHKLIAYFMKLRNR